MIDAVDTSHVWLIIYDETGASHITASADGGRTFVEQQTSAQIQHLTMLNTTEGWAVGDDGMIFHYSGPSYMFIPLISR